MPEAARQRLRLAFAHLHHEPGKGAADDLGKTQHPAHGVRVQRPPLGRAALEEVFEPEAEKRRGQAHLLEEKTLLLRRQDLAMGRGTSSPTVGSVTRLRPRSAISICAART